MTSLILNVRADGSAECLYTESLPLAAIGALEIRRASEVEFNAVTQLWEVRFTDDPQHVAHSNVSRAACIAWEVETINGRLAAK